MADRKRRCKGKTKAGKSCGANPLKPGTVIEGVTVTGGWCRTHDPDLPDSARIQGAQPGAGRKPRPREVDVIRERLEQRTGEVFDGLWEATRAERSVVVGSGDSADVVMVPDWPTRIAAYREILDRSYGRPHQSSEVTVITEDAIMAEIERMERELACNDGTDRGEPADSRALPATQGTA
jgi:hypothetical protein